MDVEKFNEATEALCEVTLAWAQRLSGLVQDNKDELIDEARGGRDVYEFWSATDKLRDLMMVTALFESAASIHNARVHQAVQSQPQPQSPSNSIDVGVGIPPPESVALINRGGRIYQFHNLVAMGNLDAAAKVLAEHFDLPDERAQFCTLYFSELVGTEKLLPYLDSIAEPQQYPIGTVISNLRAVFNLPLHEAVAVHQRLMGFHRNERSQ